VPNFDEISQYTAEIKLLPVSENGRPPYWNSTSGFDFDLCIVIDMSFCFIPAKFCSNRTIVGGVMMSYPFLQRVRIARNAERCTS